MEIQKSCWIIPYFVKDDKIYFLLIKWRHNHRGFPKWHIEKWEDCKQTALREFQEETGIPADFVIMDTDIVLEDDYFFTLNGKKIKKIVKYFIWELKDWFEEYIKPQVWEIYEIKLVPSEKVGDYLEFKSLKDIFSKVLYFLKSKLWKQ